MYLKKLNIIGRVEGIESESRREVVSSSCLTDSGRLAAGGGEGGGAGGGGAGGAGG